MSQYQRNAIHGDIAQLGGLSHKNFIPQVRSGLIPGDFFGSIVPTANQLINFLPVLHQENFALIEIHEFFLRYYKPVSRRLRPTNRIVAHRGFLEFSRPIIPSDDIEKVFLLRHL